MDIGALSEEQRIVLEAVRRFLGWSRPAPVFTRLALVVLLHVGLQFPPGIVHAVLGRSVTDKSVWRTSRPAPRPKPTRKKDIVAILAAHRIPYAATASVAFPADLHAKVRRAAALRGTRFLHVLSPCPPGWRADPDQTIRLARLAVDTRVFPLYEVWGGADYRLTHRPRGLPVAEYLRRQGRFAHLTPEDVARIQAEVDTTWQRLLACCAQPASSPRPSPHGGRGEG